MIICNNCGIANCDCYKYEKEMRELKDQYKPMSYEEKMRRVLETVQRWKKKDAINVLPNGLDEE